MRTAYHAVRPHADGALQESHIYVRALRLWAEKERKGGEQWMLSNMVASVMAQRLPCVVRLSAPAKAHGQELGAAAYLRV